MERTLEDWLPDDAPWALLSIPTLEKQCAARNLPASGGKWEMIKHLNHHQEIHDAEERKFFWTIKPIGPAYRGALQWAHDTKFRIVQVKDESALNGGRIVKHFKVTRDGDELLKVEFNHVLRYVLNCPEPLRWQRSFLSPELEDIFRHSYAVSTLLLTDWKGQDPLCALCFKTVVPTEGHRICCVTCGRAMHTDCVGVAKKVKRPAKDEQCWRCEDETEWGIDKYCEPGQVQYSLVVPGTEVAIQRLPGPAGDTTQQPNERTASDVVIIESSGSSRGEHSVQQANKAPPTSIAPATGTTTAPASTTTPDGALTPAFGTGSVENPASTSTNANISDRRSAKLVRDRGRLAKESAEMRKRAKREYNKLNKKHKKELKKLGKKSKRELERLMKKSKKLEKKAKGL
ncbi:hypothetical protein N0V85_003470 [Neurospora sp. IMI 360204]|nr:hypothetical protein N0V85_003470 [Neurospora sp. IMI 360204]